MSGTKLGGLKARATTLEKHGIDFYNKIGAKGGRAKVPKGFALMDKEKVAEAGRKGALKLHGK